MMIPGFLYLIITNYIILTNYHVVKDLPRDRNDLLLSVDFEIYDSSGRLVEIPKNSEEKKVELHLFCKEFDGEIEDILDLDSVYIFDELSS